MHRHTCVFTHLIMRKSRVREMIGNEKEKLEHGELAMFKRSENGAGRC